MIINLTPHTVIEFSDFIKWYILTFKFDEVSTVHNVSYHIPLPEGTYCNSITWNFAAKTIQEILNPQCSEYVFIYKDNKTNGEILQKFFEDYPEYRKGIEIRYQ